VQCPFVVTGGADCYDRVTGSWSNRIMGSGVWQTMKRYNYLSPILLIVVALIVRGLVTNVCMLFGLSQEVSSNIAMLAMIIVALIMFNRMTKARRNK